MPYDKKKAMVAQLKKMNQGTVKASAPDEEAEEPKSEGYSKSKDKKKAMAKAMLKKMRAK